MGIDEEEGRINNLIEINLKLICENPSKEEYYLCFRDEKGEEISNYDIDPKTIAVEMEENGLIWVNGENCKLRGKGEEIFKNGGWLKYLQSEKEKVLMEKEENNIINIFRDNKGNLNQYLRNNAFKSPTTQTINHTTESNPIKKSWIEIASWSTGIMAAGILIYEFIVKQWI